MKTAVVAFGRMNPPTKGHELLFNKVIEVSKRENGEPFVYVSHTQDKKKNPLSYEQKIQILRNGYPEIVKDDPDCKVKNVFDILRVLSGSYDRIICCAGSDRIDEYREKLPKYNGTDYSYLEILFEQVAIRDKENPVSGSLLRQQAKNGDFEGFESNFISCATIGQVDEVFQILTKLM